MTTIDKAALMNFIGEHCHYDDSDPRRSYAELLAAINNAPELEAVGERDLRELNKLEAYLKKAGYEYIRTDKSCSTVIRHAGRMLNSPAEEFDAHRIAVFPGSSEEWTAISQDGSFGNEVGLLEIRGASVVREGFDVEGWLTSDDVIKRIKGRLWAADVNGELKV